MTEDELRSYAQAVTDTDLYYKSPGKKNSHILTKLKVSRIPNLLFVMCR